MKILLVCEDEKVTSRISNALLEAADCDIIVYRYLLKALDNAQEIAPDAVIINAVDYPRHWTTFVEYMACMALPSVTVLYVGRAFSEEEAQEARMLDVSLTFCSIEDTAALKHIASEVLRMANENKTKSKVCAANSAKESSASNDLASDANNTTLIFTHPHSDAFIIGKVLSIDGETVVFAPDFPVLVETLGTGDVLQEVSYKQNGVMHCSRATIEDDECDGEMLTLHLESA